MNLDVEITIPETEHDWYTSRVIEINHWLLMNVPREDYSVSWKGIHSLTSTIMVVRFTRLDDAVAFALIHGHTK